jgi:Na+-transporting methylmalonyl-CoA/oxaloacetate decarboxylase gamma subunit
MHVKLIFLVLLVLVIAGCSAVDVTKTAKGFYNPTDPNEIEILKTTPSTPYEELGTITAVKFPATETAVMHNAIRSKVAPLGATAAILMQEGIDANGLRWAMGVAIRYK